MSISIIKLIPPELLQQAVDATVDFVVNFGKGFLKDEVTQKIKKLRSDSGFRVAFEKGLQHASERFIAEYSEEDEDLVEVISKDKTFFDNEEIQAALISILKKPGSYLVKEQEIVVQSFNSILPQRRNRDRVNKAVYTFLKYLAEEVWMLPELRPAYEFQFQRLTAEALQEQVNIQKIQLQTNLGISSDIREALLQLTTAIIEQKALPEGSSTNLKEPSRFPLHNLPRPDYERFIGRDAEISQIHQLLSPKHRSWVITIDGIGGIGKSTLALEIADRYRRQYDDLPQEERFPVIIWTTAKQTVLTGEGILPRSQSLRTLEDIYTTIAVTLQREDITRARAEEQDVLVCQALTQQRTLLIIDNLETVDDERVLTFMREVPEPTKVIVTTRHRLDIAYPIRLVAMPETDTLKLIDDTAKRKNVILTNDDSRRLYQRTGGVPSAIVWSIAQMSFGYTVETVLNRLGQPTGNIAKFCFEAVMESIKTKPAYKLVLALSLFVSDASREVLGRISKLSVLDRDEGLVELEKLSLVNKSGERFSFLPLTKSFALTELDKQQDLNLEMRQKLIAYFIEVCEVPGEYFWRYKSFAFYDDADTILEAIDWSYKDGTAQDVFTLTLAAYDYLETVGHWNKVLEISHKALELALSVQNSIYIARFSNIRGGIFYHILMQLKFRIKFLQYREALQ